MQTIELNPNQIITLNDFPLYSNSVLSRYFDKCMTGEDLPFVPIVSKDIVRIYFKADLSKKFREFEKRNPAAKYFVLDGSHRTTALTLAGHNIKAIVDETDRDINEARKLVIKGQILENATLNHTLEENCEILYNYFKEKPYFMTVQQKTDKMIRENFISPPELISLELKKQK